jgi:branched-chain amino acid transport system permease protein
MQDLTMKSATAAERTESRNAVRVDRKWRAIGVLMVLAVAGSAAPWYIGAANLRLMVELLTLIAIAQMWNLLAGYLGIVSVGPQAFIGTGAYALFWLSNHFSMNPFILVPFAAMGAAIAAILFAPLMFRLRGPYFAIGTWVLAEMFRIAAMNTDTLGAGAGLSLETIGNLDRWYRDAVAYWLALGIALSAIGVVVTLLYKPIGVALTAVKDDEAAARSLGVNVERLKRGLFVCAAAIMGMAGGLAYINVLQVSPDAAFSLNWAAYVIFVVIIGGIGTIEGPIFGVLLFFGLREMLSDYGTWYLIGLGGLAIGVMLLAPSGLWVACRNWLSRHVFKARQDKAR